MIIATLLGTYLLSSDIAFLALRRFLRADRELSDLHLFFLTRGLGPAVLSVALYVLLLTRPGAPAPFYILVIAAAMAGAAYYGRRQGKALVDVYRSLWQGLSDVRRRGWSFLALTVVVFALCTLGLGVGYPITEHDSIAAALEGRIMAREAGMGNYLAVTEPDRETGYFSEGFRTPFLHMFFVWFSFTSGPEYADLLGRAASPLYALNCVFLVGYLAYRRWSSREALWAAFLLSTTPVFFYLSYVNGIDPPRFYLALTAILWLVELAERSGASYRLALVAGAASGLALFSHLLSGPAVLAGGIGYLLFGRQPQMRVKLKVGAVLALTAFLAGAQYHYFVNESVLRQLGRSFSTEFVREWAAIGRQAAAGVWEIASSGGAERPGAPSESSSAGGPPANRGGLLGTRGHGGTPFEAFFFGRLQMFTGIEYFGLAFYLLALSIFFWRRQAAMTPLEKVMTMAIVIYIVVVLSGVRKISWSNPRYMASALPIAAYMTAPFLAGLERRLLETAGRLGGLARAALLFAMLAPVLAATMIRGAKVEITNTGSFYSDFRSLVWLDRFFADPGDALSRFWDDYLGIRKTISVLAEDERTKLTSAHDYFGAIEYMRTATRPDARALVMRDTRYFYYCDRRGYVWFHPKLEAYRGARSGLEAHRGLRSQGVTHVVIDSYSETQIGYETVAGLLQDEGLVKLVFEGGSARVYELRDPAAGHAGAER